MSDLRILVVDDNDLVLRIMEDYFRSRGDVCHVAANGPDALRLAEDRIFDLLFTDMVMPGMDGLELIKRIKVLQPQIVCILMSGLGTRRDLISALQMGVFDFLDKPIPDLASFNMIVERAAERSRLIRERDALLESLKQQNAKLEFSLQRLHEAFGQLRQQEAALESDLLKAQHVQRKFLPPGFPDSRWLDFFAFYGPCDQLGGDFFGVIPLEDGRIAVYLADVAGHGVSAAMITVTLRELMRARRRQSPSLDVFSDPASVLRFLNTALLEEAFDPPILVTMVYAVFTPESGHVAVATAGHPPPLVVDAAGHSRPMAVSGPVLGANLPGSYVAAEVLLAPGDSLLLYSDGLPETRSAKGDDFTTERLGRVLGSQHDQRAANVGHAVEKSLRDFLDGLMPADDITFIVASRLSGSRLRDASEVPPAGAIVPDSIKVVMPPKLRSMPSPSDGRIKAGWQGQTCIIRFAGLATWQLAPTLRQMAKHAKNQNAAVLELDLADCEAMDSTILGLLLQLAEDIELHQPGPRVVSQLHEMGILERFTISHEPCEEPSTPMTMAGGEAQEASSDLILSAHEALMQASADNQQRFKDVVDSLRHERTDR